MVWYGTCTAARCQVWQMAPWVEAVLSQRRAHFSTAAAARLLKARHERHRPRTRERSLLQVGRWEWGGGQG